MRQALAELSARCGGTARRTGTACPRPIALIPKVARAGAASFPGAWRRSRGRRDHRALPRPQLGFRARRAVRAMQDRRSDAAARDRRTLACRAQPGRDAALRARPAVRARVAVGQGADLSRGEPRARRSLAHASSRWASCTAGSVAPISRTRISRPRSSCRSSSSSGRCVDVMTTQMARAHTRAGATSAGCVSVNRVPRRYNGL